MKIASPSPVRENMSEDDDGVAQSQTAAKVHGWTGLTLLDNSRGHFVHCPLPSSLGRVTSFPFPVVVYPYT